MAQNPKDSPDAQLTKLLISTLLSILALWLIVDRRVNLIGDVVGALILLVVKCVFDQD